MIEIPWGRFPLVDGHEHAHRPDGATTTNCGRWRAATAPPGGASQGVDNLYEIAALRISQSRLPIMPWMRWCR